MCQVMNWVVFLPLIGCGISDWKKKTIPLWMLVILGMTAVVSTLLCHTLSAWERALGVILGLLLLLVSKCSKEAVGYGDSWILLFLGLHMGGMKMLRLLFLASATAGIWSFFFLWRRKWNKDATLPFLPFVVLSYIGVVWI